MAVLAVGLASATPAATAAPFDTEQQLTAADATAFDRFGESVDVSGTVAVVGAPDDDNGSGSGSAYVFTRNASGSWTQQAKLTPADGAVGDRFGFSVAVSRNVAVVGAPLDDDSGSGSGSAYVFTTDGSGAWGQQAKLAAADGAAGDRLGESVAVDGNTALVGAVVDDNNNGRDSGSAYVFTADVSGTWTQQAKLTAADGAAGDLFGSSVAVDGNTALVGAIFDNIAGPDSGSAYVFTRNTSGAWTQQAKLTVADGTALDLFGESVAVAGNTALVGARFDDTNGFHSGSTYVFTRNVSGVWSQQAKLTVADGVAGDEFGASVAVDGNTALVSARSDDTNGGQQAGSAYVFIRNVSGVWTQQAKLTAADGAAGDQFGTSVALSAGIALVGAALDDTNGGQDAGSAYVFDSAAPQDIDIRPGSATNPVNLNSRGSVPVAVLSTPELDAGTVDPATVCFGDAENSAQRDCTAAHSQGHLDDVDGDGDTDLLLHFRTRQTGIDGADTQACLTGATTDATAIEGCDSIRTVGG